MQRVLKKFRVLFISIFAAIFITAVVLCIFNFKVFADDDKQCFDVDVTNATFDPGLELPLPPYSPVIPRLSADEYPVVHPDNIDETSTKDHSVNIYFYNPKTEFLNNFDAYEGNKITCTIQNISINNNDHKETTDIYKVHNNYPYVAPASKFEFKDPGYYRFNIQTNADLTEAAKEDEDHPVPPDGYNMPTKNACICVSDIKASGIDAPYTGSGYSIKVDPGNYSEPDANKENAKVTFSEVDPRSVEDPEKDITWSSVNPAKNNVGTYIIYYRVKTNMPFYDVDKFYNVGEKDDKNPQKIIPHERIFYGSETIKINPKQSASEYRKSMFESATGISVPQKSNNYYYFDNAYLGSFANGSQSSGIKFKFLSSSTNDDFYRGGYLLMSDNILGKSPIDSGADVDEMFYTNNCTLAAYMNGSQGITNDIYHNAFTELERNNILKFNTKVEEDKLLSGEPGKEGNTAIIALGSFFKGYTINNNSKAYNTFLFPLSAVEAHESKYGFDDALGSDNGRSFQNKDISDNWWTRSLYRSEYYQKIDGATVLASSTALQPGAFMSSGYLNGIRHDDSKGIRPAMNFDANQVVLTSVAGDPENGIKGAKALPTTENFVKTDEQRQCTDFKFTLKDDKSDKNPNGLSFAFDETDTACYYDSTTTSDKGKTWSQVKDDGLVANTENRVIKIPYKDVNANVNDTYISAIIVNVGDGDETGSIEYYGRVQAVVKDADTLTITLPLQLEKGEYKIKLFQEKYNGGNYDNNNLSDYASTPVEVKLTMQQTIEYEESNFEKNVHIYYDGESHGFATNNRSGRPDFMVIPKEPLAPSDVKITYEDATEKKPEDPDVFTEDPITKTEPYVDKDGNVKPYIFKFKLSIAPKAKLNPKLYAEKIETVYLTIEKPPISYVAPNTLDALYDGSEHSINVQVQQPSSYHIQYSETGRADDFRDQNFLYTNANENGYKVYFKITDPNGEYADTIGSQTLIIRKRQIQYYSTSVETAYDAEGHVIEVNTNNDQPPKDLATIKYSTTGEKGSYNLDTCPSYTDAGDYTIYFQITTKDGNYEEVYGQTSLKINQATIFYTVGDLQADYNGYYHQIDMRFNNVPEAAKPTVTYYKDAAHTQKDEDAPYFKNATNGKQNVYYHIEAGPRSDGKFNYEPVDGVTTVDIRPATITYKIEDISTLTYDGDKHGAVISTTNVDDSGSTITYSEDGVNYGLVNPRYTDAGTYTVYYKIDADNFKEANGQVTFTIQQRPMSYVYIEDIPGRIFNGAPITPSVIVHDGDPSIIRNDDYDVSYTDNTAPGMGIVTLIGKHNYTGSTTKHFMIYSDSDTNGASEAYTFDTSGSNLLGLPSFGTSNKTNNTPAGISTDLNAQDTNQNPADDNNTNQDNNKNNDPNSNNTPKPKSFRDYIYIIIGGSILLLSILTVLILKIRSHKIKDKPIDVENIEIPEPTSDAK